MNAIVTSLTGSPLVLAAANLGGAIGLLLLLWTIIRAAFKFTVSAWKTNIRSAIIQIVRARRIYIIIGAKDLHYFTARITSQLAMTITISSLSIVGMVGSSLAVTKLSGSPSYNFIVGLNLGSVIPLVLIAGVDTVFYAVAVRRRVYRQLWKKRKAAFATARDATNARRTV